MKTFCVVVGQPLVVARCPLPSGACAWQHRASNFCKYTDKDLTVSEHAELVGLPPPKSQDVQALEQRLIEAIRSSV
jgi:hypothetical protein